MTTARTAKREEFLADILTTAAEGGVNYWATVTRYKWDGLPHSEYIVDLFETEENDWDTDEITAPVHHITIDTIAKGLGLIRKSSNLNHLRELLKADRTNGEEGDYDADDADAVIQFALFGEQVYG